MFYTVLSFNSKRKTKILYVLAFTKLQIALPISSHFVTYISRKTTLMENESIFQKIHITVIRAGRQFKRARRQRERAGRYGKGARRGALPIWPR